MTKPAQPARKVLAFNLTIKELWNQACPDPETETSGLRSTNNTKKIRSQENVFGLRIIRINEVRINAV